MGSKQKILKVVKKTDPTKKPLARATEAQKQAQAQRKVAGKKPAKVPHLVIIANGTEEERKIVGALFKNSLKYKTAKLDARVRSTVCTLFGWSPVVVSSDTSKNLEKQKALKYEKQDGTFVECQDMIHLFKTCLDSGLEKGLWQNLLIDEIEKNRRKFKSSYVITDISSEDDLAALVDYSPDAVVVFIKSTAETDQDTLFQKMTAPDDQLCPRFYQFEDGSLKFNYCLVDHHDNYTATIVNSTLAISAGRPTPGADTVAA